MGDSTDDLSGSSVALGIVLTMTGSLGSAVAMSLVKYGHMKHGDGSDVDATSQAGHAASGATPGTPAPTDGTTGRGSAGAAAAGERDGAKSASAADAAQSSSVAEGKPREGEAHGAAADSRAPEFQKVALDRVRCCARRKCQRCSMAIGNIMLAAWSPVFDLLALFFAPLEVLSPFAATTLLLNAIVAPALVGETLYRADVLSAAIVVPGIVLVVLFGPEDTPAVTLDSVGRLLEGATFIAWEIAMASALVIGFVATRLVFGARSERRVAKSQCLHKMRQFLWPVIAAVVGAQQMLLSKIVLELVKTSVGDAGGNEFAQPETWAFVVGALVLAVLQLLCVNLGMREGEALVVVPVYQGLFILLTTLGAGILFVSFGSADVESNIGFAAGLFLVIAGVGVLALRPADASDDAQKAAAAQATAHNHGTTDALSSHDREQNAV